MSPSELNIPKYISSSRAAKQIGVPEAVLHEWIQVGKIDAVQLPNGDIAVMENTVNEFPKYMPIPEAAKRIGTSEAKLRTWLSDNQHKDQVDAIQLTDGEIVVSESIIAELRPVLGEKEQLDLYQKFEHLKQNPISVSAASRKYDIPHPTISRWSKRGYIKRLGKDGRKVLLDEQDVAYCVAVYEEQNGGRGRQVFYPNGVPYPKQDKAIPIAA
jgi:hypothetical protein